MLYAREKSIEDGREYRTVDIMRTTYTYLLA